MSEEIIIGVGSRVSHTHFGKGVVVDATSESYLIWFKSQQGAKQVSRDYDGLKIVEAVETAETSQPNTASETSGYR